MYNSELKNWAIAKAMSLLNSEIKRINTEYSGGMYSLHTLECKHKQDALKELIEELSKQL